MPSDRFSKLAKDVDLKRDKQDSSSKSSGKDMDTGNDGEREEAKRGTRAHKVEVLLDLPNGQNAAMDNPGPRTNKSNVPAGMGARGRVSKT